MFISDSLTAIVVAIYVLGIILYVCWLVIPGWMAEREIKDILPKIYKRMIDDQSFGRDELQSLYDSIRRSGYSHSFIQFLQEVCNYMSLIEVGDDGSGDSAIEATGRIKSILVQEGQMDPFNGHDSNVSYLMKDIAKGINDGDDGFAKERLLTLSEVLKTQEEKYRKDHSITRWSFYIALLGLFISIIIGILSLNRPVHISQSDINTLKEITLESSNKADDSSLPLNAD